MPDAELFGTLLHTLDEIGEGLLVTEAQRCVFASDGFCRITGYRREELAALPSLVDLAVPEQREVLAERYRRRVAGQAVPDHYEAEIIHKDGYRVAMEVAVKAFPARGGATRIVVLGRDATERRALEDQLRQAQKMEALGRLAGAVAHDFSNLLTAILGYSELALVTIERPVEARDQIQEIVKAADRAAALTGQLLALAREQSVTFGEAVEATGLATAAPRASETILVVEDEPGIRTMVSRVLRRNGYTVLEAQDAGEAMLVADRHDGEIHLLLADLIIPVLSGVELASRIRATRSQMRVLYMSGYPDSVLAEHGLSESSPAFIQKPFTPESLLRKVRDVLRQPPASSAPHPS